MKHIATPDAPAAIGPYSQGVIAGNFLFASGQIPLDPESGQLVGSTIEEQAERALLNVKAILASQGLSFDAVVKTTCFLSDIAHFNAFNEVYGRFFGTSLPARSAVEVAALPKGALVEVEIIAYLGNA